MPADWVNLLVVNLLAGLVRGQQKLLLSVYLFWEKKPVSFLHVRCPLYRRSCPLLIHLNITAFQWSTPQCQCWGLGVQHMDGFEQAAQNTLSCLSLLFSTCKGCLVKAIIVLDMVFVCVSRSFLCVCEREGVVCVYTVETRLVTQVLFIHWLLRQGLSQAWNPSNRLGCLSSRLSDPHRSACPCPSMSPQSYVTTHGIL